MRKYINLILILAIAGTVLSAILLFQHYFPEADMGFLSCSNGIINRCVALSSSPYSTIMNIPVASFGILLYLLIAFMALIADYAKGEYFTLIPGAIFILVSFALISNLILGIIMLYTGHFCTLCISTYIINIAILILLVFYFKNHTKKEDVLKSIKNFFPPKSSDKKAFSALAFISVFFLSFAVLTGSNIIKTKTIQDPLFEEKISSLVNDFYKEDPLTYDFPKSTLVLGSDNATLKIHVFSDFLCSACYKFYNHEKFLISKYKNRIQIIYYHYPLDAKCNRYMEGTLYDNSCIASQAIAEAAAKGFFEEYLYFHFADYRYISQNYSKEKALAILESAAKKYNIDSETQRNFKEALDSENFNKEINDHIEAAEKLKIESTPTIFIAGRKIEGVPPRAFLDQVIEIELEP